MNPISSSEYVTTTVKCGATDSADEADRRECNPYNPRKSANSV